MDENKDNAETIQEVLIRKGEARDIEEIAIIEQECFSSPWTEAMIYDDMLKNDLSMYVVAELKGRVIGYIGFWTIGTECQINNVAVAPDYRKRRVASLLMRTVLYSTVAAGVTRWDLEVRESNEAARAFYAKAGFAEVGRRTGYYDDPKEDAVLMSREL